jgi:hypothetical protein
MTASNILFRNKEQLLLETNYFESALAEQGMLFATFNAGAARLLVPTLHEAELPEMVGAEYVILSCGTWPRPPVRQPNGTLRLLPPQRGALEVLFEDGSQSPYSIHLSPAQQDRQLPKHDRGRTDLELLVYTEGPTLRLRYQARYRMVASLPCLRGWP